MNPEAQTTQTQNINNYYLDPKIPYFEKKINGLTKDEIESHYLSSRINMGDYLDKESEKLMVSSRQIINLSQHVIEKLAEQEDFPLEKVIHYHYSSKSIMSNKIYSGQDMIFRLQFLCSIQEVIAKEGIISCILLVLRTCDESFVISYPIRLTDYVIKDYFIMKNN